MRGCLAPDYYYYYYYYFYYYSPWRPFELPQQKP